MTAGSASPSGDTDATGIEPFLNMICPYSWLLAAAFGLTLLFALFSLLSILFIPPSAPGYSVAFLTLVLDGAIVVVLGPLLYLCRRHNFR